MRKKIRVTHEKSGRIRVSPYTILGHVWTLDKSTWTYPAIKWFKREQGGLNIMNKEVCFPWALNLAMRLHQKCIDQTSALNCKRGNRQQVYCICLYCRILDLAQDCINLVSTPTPSIGVEILLRCMLETLADLKILVESPDYWKTMHVQALKQQIKLGKAAPANPFLNTLVGESDFLNVLEEKESEVKQLEQQGYKALSFKERFEKAKMSHEHESFYNLLSGSVHPDLMNLQNYICRGKSGPAFRVFNRLDQNTLMGDLSMMIDMLLVSSEMVHNMLKSGISFKEERNLLNNIAAGIGVSPRNKT